MEKCNVCGKEFHKKGIKGHIWRVHGEGKGWCPCKGHTAWNKNTPMSAEQKIKMSNSLKKAYQEGRCDGRAKTEEGEKIRREKLSESMKKAHAEGRAYNIGQSRWKCQPSFPEIFFEEVIQNEFFDKEYIKEYPIGKYSIDFAWPNKKLAIEIDGKQHEQEAQRNRDLGKEKILKEEGWKLLRIKWIDLFHNTKKYIKIAKDFVDNSSEA